MRLTCIHIWMLMFFIKVNFYINLPIFKEKALEKIWPNWYSWTSSINKFDVILTYVCPLRICVSWSRNLEPNFKWHQMISTQQLDVGKPLFGELPALMEQQCVATFPMKLAELQGTGLITRTLLQSADFLLCPWLLAECRLQLVLWVCYDMAK